jgi:hypothetical protein
MSHRRECAGSQEEIIHNQRQRSPNPDLGLRSQIGIRVEWSLPAFPNRSSILAPPNSLSLSFPPRSLERIVSKRRDAAYRSRLSPMGSRFGTAIMKGCIFADQEPGQLEGRARGSVRAFPR